MIGFMRALARIVVCAWTHRASWSEVGLGYFKRVTCARCDESWMEDR